MKDKDKIIAELRRRAKDIIRGFDFGKVAADFKANGFYYIGYDGVPGEEELIDNAKNLLELAIASYAENPVLGFGRASCGRFDAFVLEWESSIELALNYTPYYAASHMKKTEQEE